MKRLTTLLLALVLLLSLAPAVGAAAFEGMSPGAWYAGAARSLNRAGILWLEESRKDFPPDAPLTAGELVRFTALLKGEEPAAAGGEETVTRREMAEALMEAAGLLTDGADPMAWAVETGLLQGYPDGSLQPRRAVTYAEAAVMGDRFFTWSRLQALSIRTQTFDGRTWHCLQDICRSGGIAMEEQGDRILLREGDLTVELQLGDRYLWREGHLMNSMAAGPVRRDGLIWVSPELLLSLLTGGEAVTPSLYRAVYFFKDEAAAAVKDPETEESRRVLEQISLPTSMGIEAVRVDRSRIFQDTPIAELPESYGADMAAYGFTDASGLCYTDYEVASGAQTLQRMLELLYQAEPGLAPYSPYDASCDPEVWTLRDYNLWQSEESRGGKWAEAGLDSSDPADLERIRFLEARDILPGDVSILRKAFQNDYMERTDQELREVLEASYQIDLTGPGSESR